MEKVSAVDVFKETIAFFRYRFKYIAVMFSLMFVVSLPMQWITTSMEDGADVSGAFVSVMLLSILFGTVIQVCAFNNFITTLRGEQPSLVPDRLVGKWLKTLLKELLVFLTVLLPGMIAILSFSMIGMLLIPGALENVETLQAPKNLVILGLMSVLGSWLGLGWLGVRLGAGIAGATMNEKVSFKQSWRMTKGHSFGLMVFLLPMFVVQHLSQMLLGPAMAQGTYSMLSPGILITTLASSAVYWFTFVALSVWYVRLRKRYEAAQQMDSSSDVEFIFRKG
jgi:hypothetical protein